jgi:hypothetical protein
MLKHCTLRSARVVDHVALALASALLLFVVAATSESAQYRASTTNSAPNGLVVQHLSLVGDHTM